MNSLTRTFHRTITRRGLVAALAVMLVGMTTASGFAAPRKSAPLRGHARTHIVDRVPSKTAIGLQRQAEARFQHGFADGTRQGWSAGLSDALNGCYSPAPRVNLSKRTADYIRGFKKGHSEAYAKAYRQGLARKQMGRQGHLKGHFKGPLLKQKLRHDRCGIRFGDGNFFIRIDW